MAISCFDKIKPAIPQIMPAVIEQIVVEPTAECISVCNNAAWATGEIALQYASDPSPLEPFVPGIIGRLVPILLNSKSPKSLSENAAVTIGRLGLVCPALIAPDLGTFAQAWCTALWEIKDNEEKDSAFRGFCMMVSANPSGLDNVRPPTNCGNRIVLTRTELHVVLQRRVQMAEPVVPARQHVPPASPGVQERPRGAVGHLYRGLPACPPGTTARAVRRLDPETRPDSTRTDNRTPCIYRRHELTHAARAHIT